MNASSKLTLHQWLKQAEAQLVGHSTTPHLDAKVIANAALKGRGFQIMINGNALTLPVIKSLTTALRLRLGGVPVAYIVGNKEFYGRQFTTTFDVLIPRPDTEALIEAILKLNPKAGDKLLDVGTGTGIIAITAALEWPNLSVFATDVSKAALGIAKLNAKHLKASVVFGLSDLLEPPLQPPYRFIVANLPYVDDIWERSPETQHEPSIALFAGDSGLELIKKLITQAPKHLEPRGYLLLEADPRQHETICQYAAQYGFTQVVEDGFALGFQL